MPASSIRNLFTISGDNPELILAQHSAFTKQIPLLYFILATNSLAVAFSFYGGAPEYLTVYAPAVLCVFCFGRFGWWLTHRGPLVSVDMALAHLRQANTLATVLTVSFTAWGLAIYPYGDPYARGQVAFLMALTMIGCIFCLMHVRSAVLSVVLFANVPYFAFFIFDEQVSMRSMAVNLALVSVAMVVVTAAYFRDFSNLVESRKSTQRLSDENSRLANLDSLTNLANRRSFFVALSDAFARHAPPRTRFAIGVVDLDGFKSVNDTYGHITGDKLLIETSRRLEAACNGQIQLFRLGGDEFALIVEGGPGDDDLHDLGRAIGDAVRAPYSKGVIQAAIGCTIGFAAYPDSANSPMRLYERADYALYFAKRQRRGQVVLFSSEHEEQIRTDGMIELALQNADFEQELTMAFQPILDAESGRTLSFEALARWNSPALGHVSPAFFIPVAERTGMVRSMTKVLLRKSLAAAAKWPDEVHLAFNLSVHDISVSEGVLHIISIINQSGVDPKRIEFEITETAVSQDFEQARETVKTLKALGARVSLDDFGTGYSSLSHIRSLTLDKIKVDRSFVTDIANNKVNHVIVKSLRALCDDMNLECVVEGVETEEEMRTLIDIGCNVQQGYYFSRPIPEEQALAYIAHDALEERRGAQCAAE